MIDQNSTDSLTDDFPYRNVIYDNDYKIKIFDKLKQTNLKKYCNERPAHYPNIKLMNVDYLFNGKYNYLMYDPKKYEIYMLSDLFNDECRSICKFGKHVSPYEYYKKNKNKIFDSLKKKNILPIPINVREEIYLHVKECSVHNPLIIAYFIKKYFAKLVLDPSSGWGDRLIGSMLAGVDLYYGVDPNKCLHPNYQQIINLLKSDSSNPNGQYKLIEAGFQNVDISGNIIFDLVFTSPPYFDYEVYSQDAEQSINVYTNENEWSTNFLYPAIKKCIQHLKIGGHIILYFSQEKNKTYIEKWMKWMKILPDIYYMGNIFFCDIFLKNLHPVFIFQKNTFIPNDLYNPPIYISEIKHNSKQLNVIRDDYIIGGTKGRAVIGYLNYLFNTNKNINELMYLGASNGYAPVAFAYGLQLLKSNVKLIIYSQDTNLSEAKRIQNLATYIYPNVKYVRFKNSFKEIWPVIDKYMIENNNAFLIPFGLHDPKYEEMLYVVLKNHLSPHIPKINRLWMVIGSGVLFSVLYKILTNTYFCLVQVGKNVNLDKFDKTKLTLYQSSFKLYTTINVKIPYPTTKSYDGKIWEFEKEFKSGDYIWNVAGVHDKI